MPISLYEAGVGSYRQTFRALGGCLEKGAAHCAAAGLDPAELVETSLHPDMRPLRFQITAMIRHSLGAIAGIETGVFDPPRDRTPYAYAALQARVIEALAALDAIRPDEIDAHEGAEVVFEAGEVRRLFTAEDFLLSFSLPNFHFHAATAYDILRMKGVPLGKRDFIGVLRLKAGVAPT